MIRVGATTAVAASARTTFTAMTDPAAQSGPDGWMLATRLLTLDGPPPPAVGARMAALTGLLDIGVLDEMVVTRYQPPTVWEVKHVGRVVRGRGLFVVSASGPDAGCRVGWFEELDLPAGSGLVWPVVRPVVRAGMHRSLRRLAAGVEHGRWGDG